LHSFILQMADVEALENDGTQFAREAVESDKAGNYDKAMFFYTVRKGGRAG